MQSTTSPPAASAMRCTCARKLSVEQLLPSAVPDQIQKRKQKYPDDIDKMPIQAGDLDSVVITVSKFAKPGKQGQDEHDRNADGDMNRVQPRHCKINPVEKLGVTRVSAFPFKTHTRDEMIDLVFVILNRLKRHEHAAEQRRASKQPDQRAALVQFRRADGKRHKQTADQKHGSVGAADQHVEFAARFDKHVSVCKSIDRVAEKESAEKQHLGRKENPHSELCRIALLLDVVELLTD